MALNGENENCRAVVLGPCSTINGAMSVGSFAGSSWQRNTIQMLIWEIQMQRRSFKKCSKRMR
jgi:hypothetical protein